MTYQRSWDGSGWEDWQQTIYIDKDGNIAPVKTLPTLKNSLKQEDGTLTLKSGVGINEFSSDVDLTDNSDTAVATEKAVKTYVDTNKAKIAGDATQNFDTKNLNVAGDLTVTGKTISKDIEHMQGDVKLGDADTDVVTVNGTIKSTHSTGKLVIDDELCV
jgi:hypothetical protein